MLAPCPVNYGRRNKEKAIDTMKLFQEKTIIKNDAHPAELDVDFGKGYFEVDNLDLTGDGLEILGWVHVQNKKANGRLFTKYGILAAGVALDEGKAKVHLGKPRKWFEEQQAPPQESVEPAAADSS